MAEYINRGTFKESVEERYCKPCKAEGKDHNGCWCRACWVDDMIDEVDCFQPADVAPVVHGRWEYIPQMFNALSQLRCPFVGGGLLTRLLMVFTTTAPTAGQRWTEVMAMR